MRLPRIFYGWLIVAAAGVVQGYSSGVFYQGFQAFFDPIAQHFGWSRGATAAAISINRVQRGSLSPFVGAMLDRFGPRRLMLAGILLTGLGFVLMSRMQELWQLYASVMVLTLGMAMGTGLVGVATVGNWFIRARGRAIAILTSTSAIGALGVPLLVLLIDGVGWREALLLVGIGFWVIGFPAALVMRRRPEDYGQLPDGGPGDESGAEGRSQRVRAADGPEMTLREALSTRLFWQLSIAVSLGQLMTSANLLHLPAMDSFGVTRQTAALAVMGIAASGFVGRLGVGSLGDFLEKRYLIAAAFAMMIVGTLAMLAIGPGGMDAPPGLALPAFAIAYGLGFGSSVPLRMAMVADYFGRRSYGSVLGSVSAISTISSAAGPVFVGVMFDITGSYRAPFLILSALLAFAVPLVLLLRKPAPAATQASGSR